jgi:UDP-N-acetyl-D-galactosamine dehydrogenase
MNELSIIFNQMGLDTKAVLNAAKTKWNFLDFTPGLVGGHCIGVDPYYLTYKAEEMGYHSQIILAGRKINDNMGKYVAENTVKLMIKANKQIKGATVAVLGLTFKENCPDVRNTKVIDIINELKEYGVSSLVHDPQADKDEVFDVYGIRLKELKEIKDVDAVILAVPHREYLAFDLKDICALYNGNYTHANGNDGNDDKKVFVDIKGVFDRTKAEEMGCLYWRL